MTRTLLFCLVAAAVSASHAQPVVDDFGKCLADSTSGKDRNDLARWLYVAMGAHPDMKAISTITPSAPDESSRVVGNLFNRLITEACPMQAKAAADAAGPVAFQSAFAVLGQLAMQELMTNKDVHAGMGLLQKYIDNQKIQAVLGAK